MEYPLRWRFFRERNDMVSLLLGTVMPRFVLIPTGPEDPPDPWVNIRILDDASTEA